MDMMEVKSATEALAVAFEHYKATNDERLSQVERKNSSDAVTDDKLRRLDTEINRLSDTITRVKTAAARPPVVGNSPAATRWNSPAECEHKSAFLRYVAKGADHDLYQFEEKAYVGSDPNGGFLVPHEIGDKVIARMIDTTPMRQLATVMTTSSDALELLRDAGDGDALWVGELDARIDTDGIAFGKIRIATNELHAQPKVSQKLLDDATINIEEFIVNKIATRFAARENTAFVNGSGIGQPRGFATYGTAATGDAARAWGTFEHVGTGTAGAFASSNPGDALVDLIYKLKPGYQDGAVFMMPRAIADTVRKMKDTTGAYLWQPSVTAGQPATLLGYPIVFAEDMPALGSGSLSIAFGNFREGYTIVDRMGMRIFRDPYTAAPYVKFRCTKRTGGDVTNFEAIKFLKFS